jgi:branched-chain amino acid transport system substrate-binding protein
MERIPFVLRALIALLLFIFSPIIFLGCEKVGEKEVTIGALLPLTGSAANYGKSLQQGIELAKEEINQKGGINGKPLNIIYEDSQGDAKSGISGFNKLVSINKVPVIIGSISSVILSVAPIALRKKVVLINSSAKSPEICEQRNPFLFSIIGSGAQESRFMAQEYVKQHRVQPIAVLYSNNSSGIDTKSTFVRELKSFGGKVAIEEGYELGTTNFKPQLAKIGGSKTRMGYLIAFSSSEFAAILKQTKEMGLNIQWYSYAGFETRETLELASNAAEGVIYSYPDYALQKHLMDDFRTKFEQKFAAWPDIYTVTSYDGVKMLAKILSTFGTLPSEIQTGLRKAGAYTGIFGEIKFQDNQCTETPLLWKTVKNGQYEIKR